MSEREKHAEPEDEFDPFAWLEQEFERVAGSVAETHGFVLPEDSADLSELKNAHRRITSFVWRVYVGNYSVLASIRKMPSQVGIKQVFLHLDNIEELEDVEPDESIGVERAFKYLDRHTVAMELLQGLGFLSGNDLSQFPQGRGFRFWHIDIPHPIKPFLAEAYSSNRDMDGKRFLDGFSITYRPLINK